MRQNIIEAKNDKLPLLSAAIGAVVIPRAFDHITLVQLPETAYEGEPQDRDGLLAGVYVTAQYSGGDQLNVRWLHLQADMEAVDVAANQLMHDSLSDVAAHFGAPELNRDLTKLAILSTLQDARLRTTVPLFAMEMRALSVDPIRGLDYYLSFSSSRLMRRARRTVSEAVSQMKRDGLARDIPEGYEDFSFSGWDVRFSSHHVGLSIMHHAQSDREAATRATDGTIDSEPRDTH